MKDSRALRRLDRYLGVPICALLSALHRGTFYEYKCAFNQNLHIAKNFLVVAKTAVEDRHDHPNYAGRIENAELTLPTYQSDDRLRDELQGQIVERSNFKRPS